MPRTNTPAARMLLSVMARRPVVVVHDGISTVFPALVLVPFVDRVWYSRFGQV